jgi:hypothetical protein
MIRGERLLRARPRLAQRRENGCLSTGHLNCSHTRHHLSHRAISPLLTTMAKRCRLLKRASRVGLWPGRLPAAWWFWWQPSKLASLRLRRNVCMTCSAIRPFELALFLGAWHGAFGRSPWVAVALAPCILILTNARCLHRLVRFRLAVPANRIEHGSPDVSSEYNLQDDNRVFLLALFQQVHWLPRHGVWHP